MDLTETFLALRDIDKWMEIIIVADPGNEKCSELAKRIGAREFANAHVLTIAELGEQLPPLRAASAQVVCARMGVRQATTSALKELATPCLEGGLDEREAIEN